MKTPELTKGMKVRNTKTGKVYFVTYGSNPAQATITVHREVNGRKVGPSINVNPAALEVAS